MTLPVRQLPVLQNWDCHLCGHCCKEYLVAVTSEEKERIEAQGWTQEPDFRSIPLFVKAGRFWSREYTLAHRVDGSCVFLNEQGRCRIHERFGEAAKPLACRLFPFLLVPVKNQWRVGMRFACPSAAENKGKPVSGHAKSLADYAALLEKREGVFQANGGPTIPVPALRSGQKVEWPDFLHFVQALQSIVTQSSDRMERRLRKCLTLASLCRQARFEDVKGQRLVEFLDILRVGLDSEVPVDVTVLPQPNWVGRLLFRQALSLFARRDHGPYRGVAVQGRVALLRAALRYARGKGLVPRLHAWVPETTFEQNEAPLGPLPSDAEQVLERYYTTKIASLQFCGPTNFGLPLWDGLEVLAVTFPVLMWLVRAFKNLPRAEGVMKALSIVDDHFGYNPMLGTLRQQLSFRILGRTGELERLIAWYSR